MGIPVTLDEAAVERALPGIDVRRALEDMFRALADGRATQPPQTLSLFPDHAGDFITYLGVLSDQGLFGAKLSPYIPGAEKFPMNTLFSLHVGYAKNAVLHPVIARKVGWVGDGTGATALGARWGTHSTVAGAVAQAKKGD